MVSQSIKECQRCTANTKRGTRCKNRTCRDDLCWQHLKKEKNLRIKKSQIPGAGLGLWTTRKFKPSERIGKYVGEKMSRDKVDERYPGNTRAEYVLCPTANHCIDARRTNVSAVRFANDARGTRFKNNAMIRPRADVVRSKPQRGIPKDREIFLSYGTAYWQ